MTNQKGFILPITLVIMFIVSSFVIFQINQYVIDKKFFFEQSEALTSERLLHLAIVDSMDFLTSSENEYFSGTFQYDSGEVAFTIKPETEQIKSIFLVSKTKEQRAKQIKYYYYLEDETFLPWLEERVSGDE